LTSPPPPPFSVKPRQKEAMTAGVARRVTPAVQLQ